MKEKVGNESLGLEEDKAEVQEKILAFKDLWEQVGRLGGGVIKQDLGELNFKTALDLMTKMTDKTLPFNEDTSEPGLAYFLGDVYLEFDFIHIFLEPRTTGWVDGKRIDRMRLSSQGPGQDCFFSFSISQPIGQPEETQVKVRIVKDQIDRVLYNCKGKRKIDVFVPGGHLTKWVTVEDGQFDVM